jgi:hypothetical protein
LNNGVVGEHHGRARPYRQARQCAVVDRRCGIRRAEGHPHFVGTPTITQDGNALIISFKAAGLGSVQTADFGLTGTVSVDSQCWTKSMNKPAADNKHEDLTVSEFGTFPVRNGSVTGSFTVSPLSTLTCPRGQVLIVTLADYDLTLTGPNGISYTFP